MDKLDLVHLQRHLSHRGILMSFSGPFSHSIIEELGDAVKNYLGDASLTRSALMDVFAIYIEQAQNVRNYIKCREQDPDHAQLRHSGIVVIAHDAGHYIVSSGNLIDRSDAPGLVAHLEHLRGLDKAELKTLQRRQMREPLSAAGGGGLGLIEMARKSSGPLVYTLTDIDDRFAFFSLSVMI
jgi:hypothetical protein